MNGAFQFIYFVGSLVCAIVILIHFLRKPAAGTAILLVSFALGTLGSTFNLVRWIAFKTNNLGNIDFLLKLVETAGWINRLSALLMFVGLVVHFAAAPSTKAPLHPHNRG